MEIMIYEDGKYVLCTISKNCLTRIHNKCGLYLKKISSGAINPDKIMCLSQRYLGIVYEWTPAENSDPNDNITYYTPKKMNISKEQALNMFLNNE